METEKEIKAIREEIASMYEYFDNAIKVLDAKIKELR